MKFLCEGCNMIYDIDELSKKYNYYLNYTILLCPNEDCDYDKLTPIHEDTKISLATDENDMCNLIYVEYIDNEENDNCDIVRVQHENIENIVEPIVSYMKSLNTHRLDLNGITVIMEGE